MESSQIEAKAKEFIDALHALEAGSDADAQGVAQMFAQDATLTNSALDLKGTSVKGQDRILEFWVQYKAQLGQAKSNFHHITTSAAAAGLFWTTDGSSPSGEDISYHGVSLLQFNDEGLIEFFRGYYDTRELQVKAPVES